MWADLFERRLAARLAELRDQGLDRSLRPPAGVDLSSNDYLNLSTDPRTIGAFARGLAREGCGSTGSRLLRGGRACFQTIERRFAAFKGTERALFFGSGYLANVAVLGTLAETGDLVFSDERSSGSAGTWAELRTRGNVELVGKVSDVRRAYAHCDIVLCPSLEESFGRVVAEAMLNELPVAWEGCFGGALPPGAGDCLAMKGFRAVTMVLGDGREVDVYNLHAEAGGDASARSG